MIILFLRYIIYTNSTIVNLTNHTPSPDGHSAAWEGWKEDHLEAPPFLALTPTTTRFSSISSSNLRMLLGWLVRCPSHSYCGRIFFYCRMPPLVAYLLLWSCTPSSTGWGYNFFLKVLINPLMSPPIFLLLFLQMCLTVPASSCPPSPLKTSSQRSRTGDSSIIVRVTSPPPIHQESSPFSSSSCSIFCTCNPGESI